ncbi:MAG: SGNH/GDSL hydrolase family protein [Leptolyngbyaceae cyanobacterium MO_188.B28]|nr:SGNH/GDSL hydrolase family protein [Leptolyngbyaceae cyanobacterium MO_188.B28]
MKKVVLLGDSIFDNGVYVEPEPAVIEQLGEKLGIDWRTLLLAIDGSVVQDVSEQLKQLPRDATHLVISVGGNDALREAASLMQDPVDSAIAVLQRFTEIKTLFQWRYRQMMQAVLGLGKATTVCTIYDRCPSQDPYLSQLMYTALPMFNDCISREAILAGLPLLDLRLVCSEPEDYAAVSPIEPSVQGGKKIAACIVQILREHNFNRKQTIVYG